jgi:hypothetical protein
VDGTDVVNRSDPTFATLAFPNIPLDAAQVVVGSVPEATETPVVPVIRSASWDNVVIVVASRTLLADVTAAIGVRNKLLIVVEVVGRVSNVLHMVTETSEYLQLLPTDALLAVLVNTLFTVAAVVVLVVVPNTLLNGAADVA